MLKLLVLNGHRNAVGTGKIVIERVAEVQQVSL